MSELNPLLTNNVPGQPISSPWLRLDIRLMSLMTLMLFFGFLDRGNIGNAMVAGLQKDLDITESQYSMILTVSWIPYALAMLPSTLLLERIGANIILPGMVISWGLATVMQGFCKSFLELAVCRFFLGLFTGGLIPCMTLYLTTIYPRHFLQLRLSTFFATAAFAGAFSGILAFYISNLDGTLGKAGWAWIFIIEGLCTILFGTISLHLVPRSLDDAKFLSTEEKAACSKILREEGMADTDSENPTSTWIEAIRAVTNSQVILLSIACFFGGTTESALVFFEPIIVRGLGYTSTDAQLMSVPPFALAFALSLISGFVSDKYQCRGLVSIFFAGICSFGFFLFLVVDAVSIKYASLFFSLPGSFCAAPALGAWIANNVAPRKRRAIALSTANIASCLGGILAAWILGSFSGAPKYTSAAMSFAGFSFLQLACSLANLRYVIFANKEKDRQREEIGQDEEPGGLGNDSAWFIYSQ